MDKIKLLDSDSSSEEEEIQINESYAERYENWRKKEEYQKLKAKYGDQIILSESSGLESSDSEDTSDSDTTNNQLNSEIFDEKFLRVYSALKTNDPKIYDEHFRYLDGVGEDAEPNRDANEEEEDNNANEEDDANDEEEDKDANEEIGAKNERPKKKKEKQMNLIDYHKKLLKEKDGVTEEDANFFWRQFFRR